MTACRQPNFLQGSTTASEHEERAAIQHNRVQLDQPERWLFDELNEREKRNREVQVTIPLTETKVLGQRCPTSSCRWRSTTTCD